MRESSPPDATLRSGRGGVPGFAATRNSQRSAPFGSGSSLAGKDFDFECTAHSELGHQRRHRSAELARGGGAARGQTTRRRFVFVLQALLFGSKVLDARSCAAQRFHFVAQRRRVRT